MKTYRPWEPDRTYLLPPSTRDWLPDGHIAEFILDVLDELDLAAIEDPIQDKDPRGERPYSPHMLVALLLYGYSIGLFSSRRLAQATWTDLGARVIAAEEHPHFTTINRFRLEHHEALAGLFQQILAMCRQAGMVQLGHVAIDGTKIQANASKHKAMSYDRMKETEDRLRAEVERLLATADEVDRTEDALYGADQEGAPIPEELKRRETRRQKIREAKQALEKEAAAARRLELERQAEQAQEASASEPDPRESARHGRRAVTRQTAADKVSDVGASGVPGAQGGLPFHSVPHDRDGKPKALAQRNFTDPESRIMQSAGAFLQGYNCQIAVDEAAQVIVAHVLTNQPPDGEHLRPVLEQVRSNLGALPGQMTADAGYWSEENGQYCQDHGIDAYISTRRRRHDEELGVTTATGTPARQAMNAKVTAEPGRIVYAKRKWTVEPVFGETKEGRGFRRFRLRGLRKVRSEWALVCTGHNLLKLWRRRAGERDPRAQGP